MPIKVLLPTLLSIILQYSMVVLIYYFLFRVIKVLHSDLKLIRQSDSAQRLNLYAGVYGSSAKLIVIDSGNITLHSTIYSIDESLSIGRNRSNDIVIDDAFVSYDHACITKYKHDYWLTDLKSTNRTYLNGQLVLDEVALNKGDIIKIGAVTFKFER
ncbi:FHA domain-containing protein [bacterium BFN5]|nr:FHA domain-containing protein [bacterium BFN5]QJW46977.1 FHA domain-containing protein [bacterium BFN5]